MQTVVQKWGNSLGIRIPAVLAREFELENGSAVDIREDAGRLVITPARTSLDDLLAAIAPETLHDPVETGPSVGREEW